MSNRSDYCSGPGIIVIAVSIFVRQPDANYFYYSSSRFLFVHVRLIIVPRDPFISKMSLSIGDSFDSYSELKDRVREFERANHTQLVYRDSRTLLLMIPNVSNE